MQARTSSSRRLLLNAAIAATLTGPSGMVLAQAANANSTSEAWPTRPIKLVVGYSAGGGIDAVARMVSSRLSVLLGQQVIVENRAGAAGLIAGDLVAKAPNDGYTLFLGDSSTLIAQHLQAKMSFDPLKSFAPVASVVTTPLVIVTTNDFPARTTADFLAALRAAPGKYSFATSGVGQVQHLGFEMLKSRSQTDVVHVPYRGAAQIIPDVISGQVPIGVVSAAAAASQIKANRLKAIAVMSPVRLVGLEGVAPLSDVLPGFDAAPRAFVAAPAGTPASVVNRLSGAIREVVSSEEFSQTALSQGIVPAYQSSAELSRDLARESAMWGKVVRDQKITTE